MVFVLFVVIIKDFYINLPKVTLRHAVYYISVFFDYFSVLLVFLSSFTFGLLSFLLLSFFTLILFLFTLLQDRKSVV